MALHGVDGEAATVPLGASPHSIVLTHDGKKPYVVKKTYGADAAITTVYVLDTETRKVVKEVKVAKQRRAAR